MDMIAKFFNSIYEFAVACGRFLKEYRTSPASHVF